MAAQRSGRQNTFGWQIALAFAFGLVFLVVMLIIAWKFPQPTDFQVFVFRVVLALAAAGIGAILPGLIVVDVRPYVRAGGAIALFVIVYWFNPPALVTQTVPPRKVVMHEGTLGALFNHLQSLPASETRFSFVLGQSHQEGLRRFLVKPEKQGDSWAELFMKICQAYACLQCAPEADKIEQSVTIELKGGPSSLIEVSSEKPAKVYTCR